MTVTEELNFERAAARIARSMAAMAAIGTLAAFAVWGPKAGAGFLVGAGISSVSFFWIRGLVSSIAGGKPRKSLLLTFRYLILGGAAYVIVRFFPISMAATLAGVFIFTAAVFIEVAFEIVYARK